MFIPKKMCCSLCDDSSFIASRFITANGFIKEIMYNKNNK